MGSCRRVVALGLRRGDVVMVNMAVGEKMADDEG